MSFERARKRQEFGEKEACGRCLTTKAIFPGGSGCCFRSILSQERAKCYNLGITILIRVNDVGLFLWLSRSAIPSCQGSVGWGDKSASGLGAVLVFSKWGAV